MSKKCKKWANKFEIANLLRSVPVLLSEIIQFISDLAVFIWKAWIL